MRRLKSLPLLHGGNKIDLYGLNSAKTMLLVRSDAVRFRGICFENEIPNHGKIFDQLSVWWFRQFRQFPNHLTGTPLSHVVPEHELYLVQHRAQVVRKLACTKIVIMVRSHIFGPAYEEYKKTGRAWGNELPLGLAYGERLDAPAFSMHMKRSGGKPASPVPYGAVCKMMGEERAHYIRQTALNIFHDAYRHLERKGIILAESQFEFGYGKNCSLLLKDYVLTPDSAKFWELEAWSNSRKIVSADKWRIKEWLVDQLLSGAWNGATPVVLPDDLVVEALEDYVSLFRRITGKDPVLV